MKIVLSLVKQIGGELHTPPAITAAGRALRSHSDADGAHEAAAITFTPPLLLKGVDRTFAAWRLQIK